MVQTPQAGGKLSTSKESSSVRAPAPSTETLAAQEVEAEEVLVKTPQAGGNVIKSTRPQELSFTPGQAPGWGWYHQPGEADCNSSLLKAAGGQDPR